MSAGTRPTPVLMSLLLWCLGLGLSACHMGYTVRNTPYPAVDPARPDPSLATICVLRPQSFGGLALFLHLDGPNRGHG